MKKVALVFVVAVFAPSLVLAWLAVRSVRDQQIVVAQQQTLIYQAAADAVAKDVQQVISDHQREFAQVVEFLRRSPQDVAARFDDALRAQWPAAEVGFSVTLDGKVLSPSLFADPAARQFRLNNDAFLCSKEAIEAYWSSPKMAAGFPKNYPLEEAGSKAAVEKTGYGRKLSDIKVEPAEAEFKQLVGDSYEGTVARFVQNKLKVLMWYRNAREPNLIYGAQLNLTNIIDALSEVVVPPPSVRENSYVLLLDDAGKAAIGGRAPSFKPLVISEVGPALPHWRVALYLNDLGLLTRPARPLALMLSLIIATMIAVIGVGGTLIALDLKRQLLLARQKTDFVSNVSHELKTPLTSIRMFSELLSEGKVTDETQRRQFFNIISSETARLTRLINNVLDFARIERGEKSYHFAECELGDLVTGAVAAFRPQLEAKGFTVRVHLPAEPLRVRGDADALAQVVVNLLSNAEKYSGDRKEVEIALCAENKGATAEIQVLDRGVGVPPGCEEKIFEQFYRAHDSLSSGIEGSGLGLTLARQILRAHGGDLRYAARPGGGSAFTISIPSFKGA